MSKTLAAAFSSAGERGRSAFVGFVTVGFPSKKETVSIMLAMERGGTDVIELGVPFTDPLADGATIQRTNEIALAGDNPVSLSDCLGLSKEARNQGLTKPVILMGYYNPFLAFGLEALMKECVASGVCGFIVVDLPPEEGANFVALCAAYGLSYVPLLTPTSTDDRIAKLAATATSFLYCVSLTVRPALSICRPLDRAACARGSQLFRSPFISTSLDLDSISLCAGRHRRSHRATARSEHLHTARARTDLAPPRRWLRNLHTGASRAGGRARGRRGRRFRLCHSHRLGRRRAARTGSRGVCEGHGHQICEADTDVHRNERRLARRRRGQ